MNRRIPRSSGPHCSTGPGDWTGGGSCGPRRPRTADTQVDGPMNPVLTGGATGAWDESGISSCSGTSLVRPIGRRMLLRLRRKHAAHEIGLLHDRGDAGADARAGRAGLAGQILHGVDTLPGEVQGQVALDVLERGEEGREFVPGLDRLALDLSVGVRELRAP